MKRLYLLLVFLLVMMSGCQNAPSSDDIVEPNEIRISFETNGAASMAPVITDDQTPIHLPPNPNIADNEFDGWYLDASFREPYVPNTTFSQDTTLYAKWRWTLIYDEASFLRIADHPDRDYRLMANLDYANKTFVPIDFFEGELDGNHHTIANVTILDTRAVHTGLIRVNEGTIRNLFVENIEYTLNMASPTQSIGGLVGLNSGSIHQVGVSGIIRVSGSYYHNVGGLIGSHTGNTDTTITESFTLIELAVIGDADVGGLIGYNSNAYLTIQDSFSYPTIDFTETYTGALGSSIHLGGLVGYMWEGIVSTSYAMGSITATMNSASIGGLIGWSREDIIMDTFALVDLVLNKDGQYNTIYAGRLTGVNNGTIVNSYVSDYQTLVTNGDTSFFDIRTEGTSVAILQFTESTFIFGTVGFSSATWEVSDGYAPWLIWIDDLK